MVNVYLENKNLKTLAINAIVSFMVAIVLGLLTVYVLQWNSLISFVAIISGVIFVIFIIAWPILMEFYLAVLGLTLFGYAFLGRGFAYLGKYPLYVGEIALAIGCIIFILKSNLLILRSRIIWFLMLLMLIGMIGTISNIQTFGIDALRDAVLWGYGIFALLTSSFLLQTEKIWTPCIVYKKWIPFLLIWIPIVMVIYHMAYDIIPIWSRSGVPILNPKSGDIAVHLAGGFSFLVLRLYRLGIKENSFMIEMRAIVLWSIWFIGCVTILSDRSAIVTVISTILLIILLRPTKQFAKPVAFILMLIIVFYAFDLKITFRTDRSISKTDVVETVKSIFNLTGLKQYDEPRQWRIEWWSKIVNYTIYGKYFWTGKGYGINLANDDGFQVFDGYNEQPLRSPHNSHLSFLARSGVPGFIAWLTLQGLFALRLFSAYRRAVNNEKNEWAILILWVLTYWFAFMVNASFDVFLEGPQGGIWFWCLFGYGVALIEIQKKIFPVDCKCSSKKVLKYQKI